VPPRDASSPWSVEAPRNPPKGLFIVKRKNILCMLSDFDVFQHYKIVTL
jgi:hypothetical protein